MFKKKSVKVRGGAKVPARSVAPMADSTMGMPPAMGAVPPPTGQAFSRGGMANCYAKGGKVTSSSDAPGITFVNAPGGSKDYRK